MRISDWSSDVCSSDLSGGRQVVGVAVRVAVAHLLRAVGVDVVRPDQLDVAVVVAGHQLDVAAVVEDAHVAGLGLRCGHYRPALEIGRATSELQSLMRISYAVFCLKKKTKTLTVTSIH